MRCALRAGIFWKQILQSDAHSTSNAMKGKHRLHEPMVQRRKPTSPGSLVTIVPNSVSMVSVRHAAAMRGTPMGRRFLLSPLICREVRRRRLILQVGVVSSLNVQQGTIIGPFKALVLSNVINMKFSLLIYLLKRPREHPTNGTYSNAHNVSLGSFVEIEAEVVVATFYQMRWNIMLSGSI